MSVALSWGRAGASRLVPPSGTVGNLREPRGRRHEHPDRSQLREPSRAAPGVRSARDRHQRGALLPVRQVLGRLPDGRRDDAAAARHHALHSGRRPAAPLRRPFPLAVSDLRDLQRALPQRCRPRARDRRAWRARRHRGRGPAPRNVRVPRAFLEQIRSTGRLSEVGLIMQYKLRSGALLQTSRSRRPCSRGASCRCGPAHQRRRRGQAHHGLLRARTARRPARPSAATEKSPDDARLLPGLLHARHVARIRREPAGGGRGPEIESREIDDWNCCGASSARRRRPPAGRGAAGPQPGARRGPGRKRSPRPLRGLLQPAFGSRAHDAQDLRHGGQGARGARPALRQLGPRAQHRRPAAGLASAIEERVAARLEANPLEHLNIAAYWGCLLVRPAAITGFDDAEQPVGMDDVIAACGANPVHWNMAVESCGGAFWVAAGCRCCAFRGRSSTTPGVAAPTPSWPPARCATPTSTFGRVP